MGVALYTFYNDLHVIIQDTPEGEKFRSILYWCEAGLNLANEGSFCYSNSLLISKERLRHERRLGVYRAKMERKAKKSIEKYFVSLMEFFFNYKIT